MLGAAHSLSWDYRPGVPQGEAAERHISWKEKPIGSLVARYILRQEVPDSFALPPPGHGPKDEEALADEKLKDEKVQAPVTVSQLPPDSEELVHPNPDPDVQLARKTSRLSVATAPGPVHHRRVPSSVASPPEAPPVPPPTPAHSIHDPDAQSIAQRSATLHMPTFPQKIVRVFRPLGALVTPVTIALAVALPIALIQPLKALFVDVSETGGPTFRGPDGKPPLAFVIDTGESSYSRVFAYAALC